MLADLIWGVIFVLVWAVTDVAFLRMQNRRAGRKRRRIIWSRACVVYALYLGVVTWVSYLNWSWWQIVLAMLPLMIIFERWYIEDDDDDHRKRRRERRAALKRALSTIGIYANPAPEGTS